MLQLPPGTLGFDCYSFLAEAGHSEKGERAERLMWITSSVLRGNNNVWNILLAKIRFRDCLMLTTAQGDSISILMVAKKSNQKNTFDTRRPTTDYFEHFFANLAYTYVERGAEPLA
jgi:hypothetical protein